MQKSFGCRKVYWLGSNPSLVGYWNHRLSAKTLRNPRARMTCGQNLLPRGFRPLGVNSVHRPWAQIPAQTLPAIKKELLRYDTVYSTNYDLLLILVRHAGWTCRIYGLLLWTEIRPQQCGNLR